MPKEAILYRGGSSFVVCELCHHRCRIPPGRLGVCRARRNDEGKLVSLVYGRCVARHVDPIEKKPFFHFLPGTLSYSIATVGCNFRCAFCQNHLISQAVETSAPDIPEDIIPPDDIVRAAVDSACQSIAYTYSEPTVFFEYALDIAQEARQFGLANCFVSNGFMTPEAVDRMIPHIDAINVDLKSFNPDVYRKKIGGTLEGVLETIAYLHKKGIWLELTTLLVPGMNSSSDEIRQIARFIARLDAGIPWHVSRFFPRHEMADTPPASPALIGKALDIAREEGLRFVYTGNLPGEGAESTPCGNCGALLVAREGYQITANRLPATGLCPQCAEPCPGVWKLDLPPSADSNPPSPPPDA